MKWFAFFRFFLAHYYFFSIRLNNLAPWDQLFVVYWDLTAFTFISSRRIFFCSLRAWSVQVLKSKYHQFCFSFKTDAWLISSACLNKYNIIFVCFTHQMCNFTCSLWCDYMYFLPSKESYFYHLWFYSKTCFVLYLLKLWWQLFC